MLKPFLFCAVVALGLSFGSPAAHAQTQTEMNEQAAREFEKADKDLNVTYHKLMALLDETSKAKLKAAEREWIKFRDAQCEFEADAYRGGTMMPLIFSDCATQLTRARTAALLVRLREEQSH